MTDRYISLPEVRMVAGNKSRTTIWRWCRLGLFPKPRKIGPNTIGWLESEVDEWVESHRNAASTDPANTRKSEFEREMRGTVA